MKVTTALVALLIVGTSAFANTGNSDEKKAKNSKVAIINNTQAKYKVVYMGEEKAKVTLKVRNAQGEIVDNRVVKNDGGFALPYDFESLPSGEYTFEVISADGSVETQTVEHFNKTIKKEKAGKLIANVLDISDNQKYRLVAISKDNSPVSIKIYGDNDHLLHKEVVEDAESFRKTFDLSAIDSENIRFEVSNGTRTVSLNAK